MRLLRSWPALFALGAACGTDPASTVAPPDAGPSAETDAGSSVETDAARPPPDAGRAGPKPFITEILTNSGTGLKDEDGAASDWLEIHNPDVVPVDLGGYNLTDSKAKPLRWTFPAGTTIEPGGYLIVFASGKNRAVAGKPLHTNFNLSSGDACSGKGAYLALTDRLGAAIAPELDPYPAQTRDVSYGVLTPSPTARFASLGTPTPGGPNDAASALTERVALTPSSRTFPDGAPISVSLAVSSPTATIRYTTNRARPIAKAGMSGTFAADAASGVCTMAGHGLATGDMVRVTGPAPLLATLNYFVIVLGPDTFKLATEPRGPAVDLSASGSFEIRRDAARGTAATSDIITANMPLALLTGDAVEVSTAGTLPGGLVAGTTYYVVVASATTLRLSASPTLTPVVDITSTGSGPLTLKRVPSRIYTAPISVSKSTRVRARAVEAGRPDGPITSEMYFSLDPEAQAFTSNVPIVLTHTWNAVMSNDGNAVESQVMMFEPKPPSNLARMTSAPDLSSPGKMERHGSSTGGDAKFSMVMELQDEDGVDHECSPFGMPLDSDWHMYAPFRFDPPMMHNDLLYGLRNEAGRWAPRTRHVEHFHNEQSLPDTIEGAVGSVDYFGVYSFMERIRRGKNRVDIESLSPSDNTLPAIQGGYIFKVDRLDVGQAGIRPLPGQSFGGINTLAWVYPKEGALDPLKNFTTAQSDWLRAHIGEAWSVLNGPNSADPVNGYAKYWDVASVIEHHIFDVVTKNADAFALSSFWHKPRSGKITAGPAWDYDRAEGSTDGRDFDWSWWPGTGAGGAVGRDLFAYPWYREMFYDPNFWQKWIDRFDELRRGALATDHVVARIDAYAKLLNPGDGPNTPAKRSIQRWPTQTPRGAGSNTPITNDLFDGTFTGEVAWLKYFWSNRLSFMDSQFTRPAVSSLPPGKVAAGSKVTLTSPSQATAGVTIYYTTDGTDPRPPGPGTTPSPSAVEYQGPITISAATTLFVRTFDPTTPVPPSVSSTPPVGSRWSAPTVLKYTL